MPLSDRLFTDKSLSGIYCVHHLFEEQVRRTPQATAVCYDNEQKLNYHELNRLSNQLAHHLTDYVIRPDTRIGLCVRPSVHMLIGILGILKAGAAYVPLSPSSPKYRIEHMLRHANVRILLSQSSLVNKLPTNGHKVIHLDTETQCLGERPMDNNPISPTEPVNLALIIYTSGSTGRPEAVAIHHQALTSLIQRQLQHSQPLVPVNTLQFNPTNFDISFQELFATWCDGGTLTLPPGNLYKKPSTLWHVAASRKINRLFMSRSRLELLAEENKDYLDNEPIAPTLREIIVVGDQVKVTENIQRLFNKLPGCKLVNQYGPTEAHAATSGELAGPSDRWDLRSITGKPTADNTVYILDKSLQPVPTGAVGKIYIGGESLARGYLERDDLTAERFIENPFARYPGERLYKTKDLGRYRTDGSIEFFPEAKLGSSARLN